MINITSKMIKYVNECIVNKQIFSIMALQTILENSQIENVHKERLNQIIANYENLTLLCKNIYNYSEQLKSSTKEIKSKVKYRNTESNDILLEDFKKYEDFIYSLISTNKYKSKANNSKKKVTLYDLKNLFGYDENENLSDLLQESRLYLWEGLKKYGVFPEKEKNFKNKKQRTIASKSTFVHTNLFNSLINLSTKASGKKYNRIDVEYIEEDNCQE